MPEQFGKYILLEKLATGGMAEVYLAKTSGAENVSKYFAIKRILPQFSQNHEFIEMFKEEAKIAVNLKHSNVVSIFEFDERSGQFFIVMEYVEGRNLRQILNRLQKVSQRFNLEQIVYVINEVARGLDHAHRCVDGTTGKPLYITHRDMSPQNVMISFEGEIKIVDFGIAKAESKIENTRAGTLKGKFGYMSPEQAEGLEVDFRTDIFSLGIVLWELIAGERLFISNNEVNTLRKIRDCVVPSLRKIDPNIPQELERIVNKALARDRNLRYQSAADLHRDLSRFMNRQFPDFTSQDFGTFMKTIFEKEREESRLKMIEYGKIGMATLNDKTEYVTDHTQTITETGAATRSKSGKSSPQLQNLLPDSQMKSTDSIDLDVQFKRQDLIRQQLKSGGNQIGETSGVTSKTNLGIPPIGTGTSYTATTHSEGSSAPFWIVATLAAVIGLGYWAKPELFLQLMGAVRQGEHLVSLPSSSNLPSQDPSVPNHPPAPTSFKATVRSNPMGATIVINDQTLQTKTPAEIDVPANQKVKISITKRGYLPFEREETFTQAGTFVDAILEKADLGYVDIRSRPAASNIYVDKKYVGRSPLENIPIPADRQVEIVAYDPVSKTQDRTTITVKRDTHSEIDLFLRRSGTSKKSAKPSPTQKPKRGTSSR